MAPEYGAGGYGEIYATGASPGEFMVWGWPWARAQDGLDGGGRCFSAPFIGLLFALSGHRLLGSIRPMMPDARRGRDRHFKNIRG
jgi:hypothetical protein